MKLSKALKTKNRLVGEINKLQQLIQTENLYEELNQSKFDVQQLYEELKENQTKLISLKTSLAQENSGIWKNIFEITELKGRIQFLKNLNTKEGTFRERDGFTGTTERKYVVQINKVKVEDEINSIEEKILVLQDEIDEYNATHTIE